MDRNEQSLRHVEQNNVKKFIRNNPYADMEFIMNQFDLKDHHKTFIECA